MSLLNQAITVLNGVGEKTQEKLQKIGLHYVRDLLFHLPLRYQDRTRLYPIAELQTGQEVMIEGFVQKAEVVQRSRRMLVCQINDQGAQLTLRFFYFSYQQQQSFMQHSRNGTRIRCFGEIRQAGYHYEMVHPEYRFLTTHEAPEALALTDTLTPVYPTTEGLQQRSIKRLCEQALAVRHELNDLLPSTLCQHYHLPDLHAALSMIHQPNPSHDLDLLVQNQHPAQHRLALEELLAHHLSLLAFRYQAKQQNGAIMQKSGQLFGKLLQALPFSPTQAQTRVIGEIRQDLLAQTPMVRLVQGDVGSGKTLVAAAAALDAIENDYQVALMAPTELLAEQHYQTFCDWFEPLGLSVSWITGKLTAKERRRQVENLLLGITHIAIGTHALFQDSIEFQQLGLIIIDEQHRFGVQQRLRLREKGRQGERYPHQLVMTATPIPRTLAMTHYADMDYSIIDELPPGRKPVKTVALANERREEVMTRIHQACLQQQRQAYWVCTLIEESESLQCEAAEDTWQTLQAALPDLQIGLVHGRQNYDEKEQMMHAFKQGELHVLVATTVIEVGVDVPNASLMVIENAERLGLAQLHQLRGRVGRGEAASSCVLLYQPPLSKTGRKRLDTLRNTHDGFQIAQVDLALRGAGELLGTKQTGDMRLKVADWVRDQHLLPHVQQAADKLMCDHPDVPPRLIDRWMRNVDTLISV
jgi:ATP-dependent DNA helicase RecG